MKTKTIYGTIGVSIISAVALASDGEWISGGSGSWSATSNWKDGIVAGEGGVANFTNITASAATVKLDQDATLLRVDAWDTANKTLAFIPESNAQGKPFGIAAAETDFRVNALASETEWAVPVTANRFYSCGAGSAFYLHRPQNISIFSIISSATFGIDWRYGGGDTQMIAGQDGNTLPTLQFGGATPSFRMVGRYARAASSYDCEITPGKAEIKLVSGNPRSLFSPGQTVSGEGIAEGTTIEYIWPNATQLITLSKLPTIAETATKTLAFGALPSPVVTQRFDTVWKQAEQNTATINVQAVGNENGSAPVVMEIDNLTGGAEGKLLSIVSNTGLGGSDGRVVIGKSTSFVSPFEIKQGVMLALKSWATNDREPLGVPALWMDASAEGTIDTDANGKVLAWRDVRGAEHAYAEPISGYANPTILEDELNGKRIVSFGAVSSKQALMWNKEITGIKAVFEVRGSQEGGGNILGWKNKTDDYSFTRGFNSMGQVNRFNGLIGLGSGGANSYIAADGKALEISAAGESGGYTVYSFSMPTKNGTACAFGYDNNNAAKSGGQRLGEVIVYTNALTVAEAQQVERYLRAKWFGHKDKGYDSGWFKSVRLGTNGSGITNSLRVAKADKSEVFIDEIVEKANEPSTLSVEEGTHLTVNKAMTVSNITLKANSKLTLNIRSVPTEQPDFSDAALWLDASDEANFTLGEGNTVQAWKNLGTAHCREVTPGTGSNATIPVRKLNDTGKYTVDFGEINQGGALRLLTNVMAYTSFIVWKQKSLNAHPLGNLQNNYGGRTWYRGDFARGGYNGEHFYNGNTTARSALYTVNGTDTDVSYTTTAGQSMVLGIAANGWIGRFSCIGGNEYNDTTGNFTGSGGMEISEMIVFEKVIDDNRRRDIEAWLMDKWFGSLRPDYTRDSVRVFSNIDAKDGATLENVGNVPFYVDNLSSEGSFTFVGDTELFTGSRNGTPGVLGYPSAGLPVTNGALFWIDANNSGTMSPETRNGKTYIPAIADLVSGSNLAPVWNGNDRFLPMLLSEGCNGKSVIDFGPRHNMSDDASGKTTIRPPDNDCRTFKFPSVFTNIRTVFWMWRDNPTCGGGMLLGYESGIDFLRGLYGTQLNNSTYFHLSNSSAFVRNGSLRVDGVSAKHGDIPRQDWQVLSLVTTGDCTADRVAADRTNQNNCGGMQLGELIIYDRALDTAERNSVEDYLMSKWLGKRSPNAAETGVPDGYVITSIAGTALIPSSGTITLDGANGTLLPQGAFAGTIILKNGATAKLAKSDWSGATFILSGNSALDLNGNTALASIGGDGSVSGGDLSVGEIVIGSSDAQTSLSVAGNLTLTDGGSIKIVRPDAYASSLAVASRLTTPQTLSMPVEVARATAFANTIIRYGETGGAANVSGWTPACATKISLRLAADATAKTVTLSAAAPGTVVQLI